MDFETALQDAVSRAWNHVDLADGDIEQDTFLSWVMDYYADATHGVVDLQDEPENAATVIQNRVSIIWLEDIAPQNTTSISSDPKPLDAPLTAEEREQLDSWADGLRN